MAMPVPAAQQQCRVADDDPINHLTSRQSLDAVTSGPSFLVNDMIEVQRKISCDEDVGTKRKKKGAFSGVFIPTCENMWGVLIFLRFYHIVGEAGILQTLCIVMLSFAAAFCTTASMSSIASSGGLVSRGGPYYMISRALGPEIGASVGLMYWLAITMLAVLECLGAVESLVMAMPSIEFAFHMQAIGSGFLLGLALTVWGGINVVTKLGMLFALVVFFTIFSFYFGLLTAPHHDVDGDNGWITGLSSKTFWDNMGPHYSPGNNFGAMLSLFYPCFTGILSGANRADVLKDPPKHIKRGTFGAIIFSFLMYSSLFLLWGSVADSRYLKGEVLQVASGNHSEHAGGVDHFVAGRAVVEQIVWNPFPKAAFIGIIIASLSQSLQCLIVAPKLLQQIAQDDLLPVLRPFAKLSGAGEPVRALCFTYLVAASLVLIGSLDIVAPLLSMCFLVAYAFMNCSCFVLTVLKSPTWRPEWILKRRWRFVYLVIAGCGFALCLTIMFIISQWWALLACLVAVLICGGIKWKMEAKAWGSAMDGIQYRLALKALVNLEGSQHQCVNWRPQVLILYRINMSEELQGIKHHEILSFCSQLRKSRGFCVVACVLESETRDEATLKRAAYEKSVIKGIMAEEGLQGFAEVVVAPTWREGTSYIIQLTGIGGLVPNTVLLDWPERREGDIAEHEALEFTEVLQTALAAEKAVLAVKGLRDMPQDVVFGTIDIWWMIHDGGFLILLSWLLSQHRIWRSCHLRVFTVAENVTADQAQSAAEALTKTLQERRLMSVDVEVIILDDELIEPYTHDWTLRVEDRHRFLQQLAPREGRVPESIPLEIDDLFSMTGDARGASSSAAPACAEEAGDAAASVVVSDCRSAGVPRRQRRRIHDLLGAATRLSGLRVLASPAATPRPGAVEAAGATAAAQGTASPQAEGAAGAESSDTFGRRLLFDSDTCEKLGQIVQTRSKRAELVVMNLPNLWGTGREELWQYMRYCDRLTQGVQRVLFVHSTGREIFDIAT